MKLNVIISIKPKYVREILNGNKKYEYRKSIFKKEVEKIYIYATSPEQKIVGYFNYSGYIKDTPQKIWSSTREFSGIDEVSYYKYFIKSSCAYAINIGYFYEFCIPIDPKRKFAKFNPPQSYVYLEGDIH